MALALFFFNFFMFICLETLQVTNNTWYRAKGPDLSDKRHFIQPLWLLVVFFLTSVTSYCLMLLPVRHLTHHRLPGGRKEGGGDQVWVFTVTVGRCSQMTLSPAFSAESEMEGWVEGGRVQ